MYAYGCPLCITKVVFCFFCFLILSLSCFFLLLICCISATYFLVIAIAQKSPPSPPPSFFFPLPFIACVCPSCCISVTYCLAIARKTLSLSLSLSPIHPPHPIVFIPLPFRSVFPVPPAPFQPPICLSLPLLRNLFVCLLFLVGCHSISLTRT